MIWSIGIAVFVLLMETMRSHNTAYYSENNSFYWLVMTFTVYVRVIGNLLVCMGISSVVIGLTQRIRRYRLVMGTVVFLSLCISFFFIILPYFRQLFIGFINRNILEHFLDNPLIISLMYSLFQSIIPVLIGLACIYLGFYLFGKFSEV